MSTPDIATLGALLAQRATEQGEKTFVQYDGTEYTYSEMNARANAIANSLYANGINANDVVCLYMYNRPEFLVTLFALAKLGAVAAPIDTRFTDESLAHVLTQTETDMIILDGDTRDAYEAIRNDGTAVSTEFYVGDQSTGSPYRQFDVLLEADTSNPPNVEVSGSDPCAILYVRRYRRGTPQGVVLPHYAYINTGWKTCRQLLDLTEDDCIFTTLPLYSSYPVQIGVTGAMVVGAEFAFEKQFDKDRFWDWIRQYDTTVFLYLGRMLSVLYNQAESAGDADNPASYAIGHGFGFGTDKTMIGSFERRFDIEVLEAYGITPTATLATANRPDDRRLGSVGRPTADAAIKIVDEDDWEVPTGETGEILVRPTKQHTMFREFYDDDELTAAVCRNQWIHTNDIGYVDEDGYLYFVASKKNTIHLGRVAGRISSLEIESVIAAHPDVNEAVVLGISKDAGEDIKAVVVPEDDATVNAIDINEHCMKQLTYHKLPRYIEITSALPRTRSGKVDRGELRETTLSDVWDRESGYDLNR